MRVIYAGTPDFAVPALQALVDAGHELVAVYTQPDRPAGRGRKLQFSPVKQRALDLGLPVCQPQDFKSDEAVQALRDLQADVLVVAAYGLILPLAVLQATPWGGINIHASLLPRWRGAAPIQRAIEAGDGESGVAIMQMAEGLDSGDVFSRHVCPIGERMNAAQLHDALADVGAGAIVECLEDLRSGRAKAQPQDEAQVCYAHKLTKAEALIDWSGSARLIDRRVRAFNPWPVAFSYLDGTRLLRIWQAQVLDQTHDASPGTVLACSREGLDVACGEGGVLRILRLQLPGKKALAVAEFAAGHDWAGRCLSAQV